MLPIALFSYAFALWLGLYLLARDARQPLLRFTGAGLVTYALAVAGSILTAEAVTTAQRWVGHLLLHLALLPPLLWAAAMVLLLPEDDPVRLRLQPYLSPVTSAAGLLLYGAVAGSNVGLLDRPTNGAASWLYTLTAGGLMLVLLLALGLSLRVHARREERKNVGRVLVAVTLFFGLGLGLLLLPPAWLPPRLLLLAIAPDLVLLGGMVALLDAYNEGEALWPDLVRSFVYAGATALLFAGQVGLVIWLATGLNFAMALLLLLTAGSAILLQTLSAPLASFVDGLALARFPQLRQSQRRLRDEAGALMRRDETLDPTTTPEEKFNDLTRRAFSHLGNLPKLASSPLTRLPLVEQRLAQREAPDTTLERAAILRTILIESTQRLKPRNQGDFGTTDEWRHYNALYFPYVAGLRPYSRRASHDGLSDVEQKALEWFRGQVPQRTLYNWQTAAAELVAQDLREREAQRK
jgi:hypothetical protein